MEGSLAPRCGRRVFILGSAAAGLVPSALSAAETKTAESTKTSRILFGACRYGVEDVALMKSIGYDFWEWLAESAFNPAKDAEWWKRQRDEIAKRPLPLRSCTGFIPSRFRLTGPEADHAPALDYAETVMRRADEAGLQAVVFGSGGARNVPGDFFSKDRKWRPDLQKGAEQYAEFCAALAKRIADLKTACVVIEPLRPKESNIVNFVWQGRQIVEDVASPRIMLLADIYHMMEGREEADSIIRAGKYLRHCHIADWKTRSFPGANPAQTYRLKPYFDALKAVGYCGGVSCECGWGNKKDFAKNLEIALKTMKGMA